MKATLKKSVIGAAVAVAMGASASASADTVEFNYTGLFTVLTPTGAAFANNSQASTDSSWAYGLRTAITGTMTMNTTTGVGSATVAPFDFSSGLFFRNITLQAIGNGAGGNGTLLLGNMLFNWLGNNGIPVSIVLDAQGMFGAMQQPGFAASGVIDGTYGVLGASDGIKNGNIPMGKLAVATTTSNTTAVPGAGMGTAVSGQLPLIADSIGGSPMIVGPLTGFSVNLDITSMAQIAQCWDCNGGLPQVPVPAAAWLLGSGLLGLIGVARRKAA